MSSYSRVVFLLETLMEQSDTEYEFAVCNSVNRETRHQCKGQDCGDCALWNVETAHEVLAEMKLKALIRKE
jgi:hypothetical protein